MDDKSADKFGVYVGQEATTQEIVEMEDFLKNKFENVESQLHRGRIVVGCEE